MNKTIFEHNGKEYNIQDIVDALKKTGIQPGDTIFVHSDLRSFGKICEKLSRNEFINGFVEALRQAVGEAGNVIVPTFSYSFCNNEIFDPANTPSTVGILTEYFRNIKDVSRSGDPIFSVAALGPDKDYFTNVGNDCFGKGSVFEKMHDNNVKLVFLGETFDMTYLHYIEQDYGVPHRFIKTFKGKARIGGKVRKAFCDYYVKPLDKNIEYDLDGLSAYLEEKGALKISSIGNSRIRTVSAAEAYKEIIKAFGQGRYFLRAYQEGPARTSKSGEPGREMYGLIKELFPIHRSITGNGVRETLKIMKKHIPLIIYEIPTGTRAFDWTVPKEWNVRDAYVMDREGRKIIDFKKNNLHVVGYSTPVDTTLSLQELQEHLHSLPEQPAAIPYVTSYYQERWGFCLTHNDRQALKEGEYQVFIDSELKDGSLTYGELVIPGRSKKEIFLSTYICHPSMANNELSGPTVTTFLAKWLLAQKRRYTYRIIFVPETIGSLAYLSRNLDIMKNNIIAGFNITCVGDDRAYSYLPSRNGATYADRVALKVLTAKHPDFIRYSFLDRGSDERQYNAPGVDLPVCSVMRSKYGAYPEYHTSLDDLTLVSPEGLAGAYDVLKECLTLIEKARKYQINCLGEPQLGKRGLYPTISARSSASEVKSLMDFIAYADGNNDLIDISDKTGVPVSDLRPIVGKLLKAGLLAEVD